MTDLITGPDGQTRCAWSGAAPEFAAYHDTEWGFPVADGRRLFEKLSLEGFQSGLSWRTISAKRDNFRTAFADFDIDTVAGFDDSDITGLLGDAGIVRHRGKIEALINNARCAQRMRQDGTDLAAFVWDFEAQPDNLPPPQSTSTSPASIALSKALRKQGWKFVGPTTVFAFMQAMGLINDHTEGCVARERAELARNEFTRPRRRRQLNHE